MQIIQVNRDRAFSILGEDLHGQLYLDGLHIGVTLEKRSAAIQWGICRAFLSDSKRFQRRLIRLKNVPGREAILIHAGNTIHHTEGCILVGERRNGSGIINSTLTLNRLLSMIMTESDIIVSVTEIH